MAEGLLVRYAEGAVNVLIGKLARILSQELQLLRGVKTDAYFIKGEVEGMQSFLKNLARSEDHDDQVKTWMKQVREVAYDAEDCIDQFLHKMIAYHPLTDIDRDKIQEQEDSSSINQLRSAWVDIKLCTETLLYQLKTCRCSCDADMFSNSFLSDLKLRHKLGMVMQNLRRRAKDVSMRRLRYAVSFEGNGNGIIADGHNELGINPQVGPIDNDLRSMLCGIEDPEKDLIELIKNQRQRTSGALSGWFRWFGKDYPSKGISQKFDLHRLLLNIMKQLSKVSDQSYPLITADSVRGRLAGMKYLVVLDDVWSIPAWDSIKNAFPDEENSSRLLITTRMESVANACSKGLIYRIEPLSDGDAVKLFWKIMGYVETGSDIIDTKDCTKRMEPLKDGETSLEKRVALPLHNVASKIIKKCGGMPLAITYITKLLASKQATQEEWEKFSNSIGSQLENHPNLGGMKQILTLSYNVMPYHLKTCLLYLSIYPEDYDIKRKNLVRRWVAEGFVAAQRGMTAEEVVESYFEELVNRSKIQRGEIGYSGKIKTCRVHDMMLEIIVSKSIEQNFVTIIGERFLGVPEDTIRRLTAHNITKIEHAQVGGDLRQVRSFTAFGDVKRYIWSFSFRLLRVLDLEGCKGLKKARLNNMCKLFLLRFLSLRATGIARLPEKIGDLKELETLDIRQTMVQELPVGITKLRRLSHLLAGSKRIRRQEDYRYLISDAVMPDAFDSMESIQTVCY
uniref:Rx N-terminal domain-containing protein n=1 Tax=Leersia perrieri TaxID=77586 RepID=A0A0D9V175_9ORYZ